jgi:hypothetical protein
VPDAPVFLKQLKITLVEVYGTPTQIPIPGTRIQQSRVRYANRAGIWPSSYLLQCEVWCHNSSKKRVEALALTVIPLDAFNQTIESSVGRGGHYIQRVVESLPTGSSTRVTWEQPVTSSDPDIFEVAILVTAVRFDDGNVWTAPQDEVAKLLFAQPNSLEYRRRSR